MLQISSATALIFQKSSDKKNSATTPLLQMYLQQEVCCNAEEGTAPLDCPDQMDAKAADLFILSAGGRVAAPFKYTVHPN